MEWSYAHQLSRILVLGAVLYVVVHEVFLAYRRKQRLFALAALWAGVTGLIIAGRYVQHASSDPATVRWAIGVQYTVGFFLAPAGLILAREIAELPWTRLFKIALAASIAFCFVPLLPGFAGPLVWTTDAFGGTYLRMDASPWMLLVVPYAVLLCVFAVRWTRRANEPERRRAVRVVGLVLVAVVTNDLLMAVGTISSIQLLEYGFAVNLFGFHYVLMRDVERGRENLARAVEERTRELDERRAELSSALRTTRTLIDGLPDAVWVYRDGTILFTNPAGSHYLGYDDGGLDGADINRLVPAEEAPRAAQRFAAIETAAQPSLPVEQQFLTTNGRILLGELVGLAIELDGKPAAVVTIRDRTERNALAARARVADRHEAVAGLAAGVAHEINNPLTYIIANARAGLHLLKSGDTAELKEMLQDIADGGLRIGEIVRDLGTLTREPSSPGRSVDVTQVLRNVTRLASNQIEQRAELICDLRDCPRVAVSQGALSQVCVDLLLNSIESLSSEPGSRGTITITAKPDRAGSVIVSIRDTGRGIEPANLAQLFDPFFTTKDVGEGTGLGLWTCKRIIHGVGGTLEIDSEVGVGTEVTVTLPAATGTLNHDVAPVKPNQNRRRILVVDDEPSVARGIKRLLRDHDVTIAGSGSEAVEACENERFDMVLCDLMMPDMNGMQVYEHLVGRELLAPAQLVFMTGGTFTLEAQTFVDEVDCAVLPKPLDPVALRSAISGQPSTRLQRERLLDS